jgi:hypothetical protein
MAACPPVSGGDCAACLDRASRHDRRRVVGIVRLPAARRPRLSARGHGAAADLGHRAVVDEPVMVGIFVSNGSHTVDAVAAAVVVAAAA